jgi:hypothetical protein
MFIGQGSSIIGVCVVYGLSPLMHPFNCLYKPLIEETQDTQKDRERYTKKRKEKINIKRERESL